MNEAIACPSHSISSQPFKPFLSTSRSLNPACSQVKLLIYIFLFHSSQNLRQHPQCTLIIVKGFAPRALNAASLCGFPSRVRLMPHFLFQNSKTSALRACENTTSVSPKQPTIWITNFAPALFLGMVPGCCKRLPRFMAN